MENITLQQEKNDHIANRILKLKIFFLSFALIFCFGLFVNYSRPEVYQNSALILTTAPKDIDQPVTEIDLQHVTIQKNKFLSAAIITETFKSLSDYPALISINSSKDLREMLSVNSTEDTNIITLYAQGPEPDILYLIINTWVDVYLKSTTKHIKDSVEQSTLKLENELRLLDAEVTSSHNELDTFRKHHHIDSTVREENTSAAKLKGLSKSLNHANEDVVKAKAHLDSVNLAIARGDVVVPQKDQRTLHNLEQRYQELKERLTELDKQYTRQYLALQPSLRILPDQIQQLEKEIYKKRRLGQRIVKDEAIRNYDSAKQVVKEIEYQLGQHKRKAAEFTSTFERHQQLINNLSSLEELQRQTRERLIKIKSKQFTKFPQVNVLERASISAEQIAPNYLIGTAISFFIALIISGLIIWLYNFLTQPELESRNYLVTFPSWVKKERPPVQLNQSDRNQPIIDPPATKHLSQNSPTKILNQKQIITLLEDNETDVQQLIYLLLSGLTLEEISQLSPDQIRLEHDCIVIDSDKPRNVSIGSNLKTMLSNRLQQLWDYPPQPNEADLYAMLHCAKENASIEDISEAKPLDQQLRYTYIDYLVRQGLKLSHLSQIVGDVSDHEMNIFSKLSSADSKKGIKDIYIIYPLCEVPLQ